MSLEKTKEATPGIRELIALCGQDHCSFLLRKLKRHHRETYFHSIRVAALCAELSVLLGIPNVEKERMICSALLHDIGKIRIDKSLLDKQGPLNREEWDKIKHHCRHGYDILSTSQMRGGIDLDIILYHHENMDGTGYYGIRQNELTTGIKILRVADSYDAMIQPRAYSQTKSSLEALEELYRWSGVLYEPNVVEALHKLEYAK